MINNKFKFTYRHCAIIGTPLKNKMNVSIWDLGINKIFSANIDSEEDIKMHQLLKFCHGYIDRHIQKIEDIGKQK